MYARVTKKLNFENKPDRTKKSAVVVTDVCLFVLTAPDPARPEVKAVTLSRLCPVKGVWGNAAEVTCIQVRWPL